MRPKSLNSRRGDHRKAGLQNQRGIARNLGIGARVLGRWKRKFEAEQDGTRPGPDEREEIARFRRENKRLRQEGEIL